jgi:hypothetical protein
MELTFEPHDFNEIFKLFLTPVEQILLSYKNGNDH